MKRQPSSLTFNSLSVLFLVMLSTVFVPLPASAIPAFTRAYDVPCSTCHTSITRRSEFGDVFRKAGFRWPGRVGIDAKVQRPNPIEMKGIAAQKGLFPAQVPLGFVAQMAAVWNDQSDNEEIVQLNPPGVTILFGSTLGEHFSFFGTWSGSGSPEEIYLHSARILGRAELNLRAGQFEQTTTLFKNNESLIAPFWVSTASHTQHSVGAARRGLELNGVLFNRTFYALGTVKNGGLGSSFDYYYHLSQKIGGMDLHGEEPDIDLDNPSLWDDITLTLGHYGYFGESSNLEGEALSKIMRFGLDAKLRIYDLTLWGGAMMGLDRDHVVSADNTNLTWFAEMTYSVTSWMLASYAYQYQDASNLDTPKQRHDGGFIFLPLENVRVRLKYGLTDDTARNMSASLHLLIGF